MGDEFDIVKCRGCGKDVFPSEKLIALKSVYHKQCLKCSTCGVVLNSKTLESWKNDPYCKAHLVKAKMGGGTQTAYQGAEGVTDKVSASTKNWDIQKEMNAAKTSGYKAPESKPAEHQSQIRKNPQAEIDSAKKVGYKAPEGKNAEHPSQIRRNPQAEIDTAKKAGGLTPARDEPVKAHPSTKGWNPQEEIAAARAQGYQAPEEPRHIETTKETIKGGNVSAAKNKFANPPAETPAPSKPAPKPKAAKAPAFIKTPEPEPEPEPEPIQEQPVEQTYEEQPVEQTYEEQPVAEQTYEEQPVAEQTFEEQPAAAVHIATALYDYAGEAEGDLTFSAGDVITILDTSDPGGWWQGELNGVQGVFPSNFVQINE